MALHTVTVDEKPYVLQSYGDTIADLPAAPQHEAHRVWIESIQTAFLSANVAGVLLWRVESAGGIGSKYWVNPLGKSPAALYNTVQAGIDAANADWIAEARTGSRDVFILPGGTYVENPTLKAGVNLIALQGERTSPSLIQGAITTDIAEAQTNTLRGIACTNGFAATGGKTLLLEFDECRFSSSAGFNGFIDGNSVAASVYIFRDSTISTADAGTQGLDMGATGTLLCERCTIGELASAKALRTNSATSTFRDCQFMGTRTLLAGATATLFERCTFDSDINTAASVQSAGSLQTVLNCKERGFLEPLYTGTGTLAREGANIYTNASQSASTITEAGAGTTIVWQTTKLSGLGPHVQNALARAYLFLPGGAGAIAAMTLLNTSAFADHVPVTFINRDPAGSQVRLTADAGNTIDSAASLLLQGSITLIPDRATGTWFGTQDANPIPASPVYYVASTGSDAQSTPGTSGLPLLTLQEAFNRLGASGWSGSPTVIVKDTLNLGASPQASAPAPIGNALPILLQTTYTTDVLGIAATGGTQGVGSGGAGILIAGGTFTSADGSAANTQRGKLARITAGPNIGTRAPIESNDGAGGYTVSAKFGSAPSAANVFDVVSRTGKLTWSGTFVLNFPGGLIVDGIEYLPTGASAKFRPVGTYLQESAVRYVTATTGFLIEPKCQIYDSGGVCSANGVTATTAQMWNPSGVTPCGPVYDGTLGAGTLGGSGATQPSGRMFLGQLYGKSWDFIASEGNVLKWGMAILEDCGVWANDGACLELSFTRCQNGRSCITNALTGIFLIQNATGFLQSVNFPNAQQANNLVTFSNNSSGVVSNINGAAACTGAGKVALNVLSGSTCYVGSACTATGTVAGTDLTVDGGTGMAIATASLLGAVRSNLSGASFTSTTDNSATPAIANIVNKASGREALPIASGAVFTLTNSLIKAADDVFVQLIGPVTAAINPVVVVTDGQCVITFAAAAAGTSQKFSWELRKRNV